MFRLIPQTDHSDAFEELPPKKSFASSSATSTKLSRRVPSHLSLSAVLTLTHTSKYTGSVHAPDLAQASTPLLGHLSDDSHPGTPPIELMMSEIADRFFASGSKHAEFLKLVIASHNYRYARPTMVLQRGVVESPVFGSPWTST